MEPSQILVVQFSLSLVAYSLAALWFVVPWLDRRPYTDGLTILALPHLLRHVGMTLLVPGVVGPGMPGTFARATAGGDLATVFLAWAAIVSLRLGWRAAVPLVWIMNVVGSADLVANLVRAMRLEVASHLQAAWFVPAFVVPFMVVAHALLFRALLRGPPRG